MKNERVYRFMAKNYRLWSLLILLLLVASIRRKLLKTTLTEEQSVHTNSESCTLRRKKIYLIPNKSYRYIFKYIIIDNFSTHLYKVVFP